MITTEHIYRRQDRTYLKDAQYTYLLENNLVIDASQGGLLIGPTRQQGGLYVCGWNRDADIWIGAWGEGWDFLINAYAEADNRAALAGRYPVPGYKTNLQELLFRPYGIPAHISVIDASPRPVAGQLQTPVLFITTNQMALMPKVGVKAHLEYLDRINRESWQQHLTSNPEYTIRQSAYLARFPVHRRIDN